MHTQTTLYFPNHIRIIH